MLTFLHPYICCSILPLFNEYQEYEKKKQYT